MPRKKQEPAIQNQTKLSETPELSSEQKASLLKLKDRMQEKNRLKVKRGEKEGTLEAVESSPGMAIVQAMETTGSADQDAANILIRQVTNAQPCPTHPSDANAAIALVHGIAPQDELEGMLATQMVAVHNLSMEYARRSMGKNLSLDVSDSLINRTTKLMNVFTRQVEALNKYRNRGQQKITVQHVQVGQGGQAIIGDVHSTGHSPL